MDFVFEMDRQEVAACKLDQGSLPEVILAGPLAVDLPEKDGVEIPKESLAVIVQELLAHLQSGRIPDGGDGRLISWMTDKPPLNGNEITEWTKGKMHMALWVYDDGRHVVIPYSAATLH